MPKNKLCQIPLNIDSNKSELVAKNSSTAVINHDGVVFKKAETLILDAYFSVFSVGKWNEFCAIKTLSFNLRFFGKLLVKIRSIEPGHDIKDFQEFVIESALLANNSLTVENFTDCKGLFTVEIQSLSEDSSITELFWATDDDKKNDNNKLAVVITTFNRQEAVTKATKRIIEGLRNEIPFHIYVIDNGSNLTLSPDSQLTLIPNKNYGGAGGFSRGLVEVIDSSVDYSHCLFMDDDASCDVESILRSFRLLSVAVDVEAAVAGGMLLENKPYMQHESGALFNGMCQPLKHGLDLRDLGALVENERLEHIDYGGWWFFMFPVTSVKELAFPFFVRGDDSNFSMQHNFNIVTLNGVGSWQDDFSHKSGPMTEYLDLRYHLVHRINIKSLDDSLLSILKIVWRFIMKDNNKYCYASARASCVAFDDFMKGPSFFEDNLDTTEIRGKIGKLGAIEKPSTIEKPKNTDNINRWYLSKIALFIKPFTLSGHLIPKIFFINSNVIIQRSYGLQKSTFLAKNVTFYYTDINQGVTLPHSKRKYFSNIGIGIFLSVKCAILLPFLRKKYKKEYSRLVSISSWKKRYQ